jgi:UDP-N-acetylglucosamine--N-acetylmuramyl-(pentapeptide) pyrophosphoryl-undecaprenol N-acetylglucosamine transferase
MLAAAAAQRLPAALLEIDAHLGLANRMAAPFARRVFLSFPIDGLEPPRYQLTGRPVPRSVLDATAEQGRREFDLPAGRRVVLVFGGSLGATTLNRAATAAWAADDPGFTVVHITGEREFALSSGRAAAHYRVLPYTPGLGPLLAACDLVVARAGGSVFEIAAAGKPAILVPSPNVTADHQSRNAEHIADGGAAIVIADSELTAVRLSAEVDALLAAPDRLLGMGDAARRLARPDAGERIATELLALAR